MPLRRRVFIALLLAVAAAAGGWVFSGHERVTKAEKNVLVREEDISGEIQERFEPQPGPLFGYYLGLDALAGTVIVSGFIYAATWWFTRQSAVKPVGKDENG